MMKILFIALSLVACLRAYCQKTSNRTVVESRIIYGVVEDTLHGKIAKATISLVSPKDTLLTHSNDDGRFTFENVRSSTFVLTVTQTGFVSSVVKSYNNEEKAVIMLPVVFLKSRSMLLKEVSINGVPSILYKTDTVEYRAQDYKVREYSNVDELLKKMPGIEVAPDGTVTYQGQQVSKARLNGKDFAGGDVALAVKNLPADIVEKIQIVDYYGDGADRTGIKEGEAKKLINISTRMDRSIGSLARIEVADGSDSRYNANLFLQYINANKEIGVIGDWSNNQNGVAPNPLAGSNANTDKQDVGSGSGGTINKKDAAFYYRDQLGKSMQINFSYNFSDRAVTTLNNSTIQQFSTYGTNDINNSSNNDMDTKKHVVNTEFEYAINSNDFIRVSSNFNYSKNNSGTNLQQMYTGLTNLYQYGLNGSAATSPTIDAGVLFQHKFNNPVRNLAVQIDINNTTNSQNYNKDKNVTYFNNAGSVIADSTQNYFVNKHIATNEYKGVVTYMEPLGYLSHLEVLAKIDYASNSGSASIDSINAMGVATPLNSASSNYQSSFTHNRLSLGYWRDCIDYNFTIGIAAVPYFLDGMIISSGNGAATHFSNTKIIPILKFQYIWSSTEKLSLSYSGEALAPTYSQLQPFVDKSDPLNVQIGNPNLTPSFYHSVTTQYNNYITKSKINLTAIILTSIYENQVVTNTVQTFQQTLNNYVNKNYYVNYGDRRSVGGFYNVAKQIDDNKYIISLLGRVGYTNYSTMTNSILGTNTSWRFTEKLGARLNPNNSIEVNPYISYDIKNSFFSVNSLRNSIKTVALSVDGKLYFLNTWLLGYSASKNYITGIEMDITKNPLILNTYLEKSFLKRRNLIFSVQIFDVLHQNNLISQSITDNTITDTKTNGLSRYVMLSMRLNLQKWAGTPTRNGLKLQRRGDGSFIYN